MQRTKRACILIPSSWRAGTLSPPIANVVMSKQKGVAEESALTRTERKSSDPNLYRDLDNHPLTSGQMSVTSFAQNFQELGWQLWAAFCAVRDLL